MKVAVKMDENEIRAAIAAFISRKTGVQIVGQSVKIEVKSKQNYRSEWEQATIRAEFDADEASAEF